MAKKQTKQSRATARRKAAQQERLDKLIRTQTPVRMTGRLRITEPGIAANAASELRIGFIKALRQGAAAQAAALIQRDDPSPQGEPSAT